MGRKPNIWLRQQNKTWYVKIGGKQVNLGKDKKAAEKRFHQLIADRQNQAAALPVEETISAAYLMDKFLLWCSDNRAPRTFEWYRDHLQMLLDRLPNQDMGAMALKPFHVYETVKATWSANYKRGFLVACQRAFKWGVSQGYLDKSPLEYLEKPSATRRDNCPTEDDYWAMLKHTNDCYKDILEFAWETGARPQEMFMMQTRHFKDDRIEFPVDESKGKKHKRIIYLTAKASGIVAGLTRDRNPNDFVFINTKGRPWNANSAGCRMGKLQRKRLKNC